MQAVPVGFAMWQRYANATAYEYSALFELLIDPAQLVALKAELLDIINEKEDSVRIYRLGSNWKGRIEQLGKPQRIEQDAPIVL